MAYSLNFEEPVTDGVIRIAREQIRAAIDVIDDSSADPDEAIHDVRRHCKLLRALVRLVRPSFPGYRAENVWFRDIGRSLSLTRDAKATIEAMDSLTGRFHGIIHARALAPIRDRLEERRQELHAGQKLPFLLGAARRDLEVAHRRCGDWRFTAEGFEAVAGGLEKTYRRARRRMYDSRRDTSTLNLHQWRKRTKYHRYHLKLLRQLWGPVLNTLEKEAHALTDYLGDDHDLAVLSSILLDEPARFGHPQMLRPLFGLIRWRRAELQKAAFPQGARLFSTPPGRCIRWFSDLWEARVAELAPRPPQRTMQREPAKPSRQTAHGRS
ncbi:MAG: CHAD domain-containing protein [Gammaproteobacteria bacterium]|jgi:CHAD domain-containing protein